MFNFKNKYRKPNSNIDNGDMSGFILDEFENNNSEINKVVRVNKLQNRNKRKHIRRSNQFEILLEDILNRLTKGNLELQQGLFEISYNRIMADKHCKQVFQIIELPQEGVKAGYIDEIRKDLKSHFNIREQLKLNIISVEHITDNYQDLSSRKLKGLESSLEKQVAHYEDELRVLYNPELGVSDVLKDMSVYDRRMRSSLDAQKGSRDDISRVMENLERVKRKQKSFDTVQSFQRQGGHCINMFLFIELYATELNLLIKASDVLRNILTSKKYVWKEILDLSGYQKIFGVASMNTITKKTKFDSLPFLSTSNIPVLSTDFESGIIRSKQCEMYLGNQVDNKYRVDISLTDTNKAENYLLVGKTGSGKSVYLATALLTCMDNKYLNIIIKDYKGREWSPFANLFGDYASIIAMDNSDSAFVNTYKIPDYKKFGFDLPENAFALSTGITIKILTTLTGMDGVDKKIAQDICTDIVNKVYMNYNIKMSSYSSYEKSNNIDFRLDTWLALLDIVKDNDTIDKHGIVNIHHVMSALQPYFGYNGIKNKFFDREIDLDKLLFHNKVLVFDYGAQSIGGAQTQTENEIKMRMLQESFCENLYCALRKKEGQYTIVVTEEINQQLNDKLVCEELCHSFTGGRTSHKINIGITNTVNSILTSIDTNIIAIRENITGYIIGKCDEAVINDFIKYTSLKNLKYSLYNVSKGIGNYEYSFLFHSTIGKIDSTVVKMPITDEMMNLMLSGKKKTELKHNYSY